VPLSQELEHVKSYLEIQQVRYANRFTFEIAVDRELQEVTVLKLLLQPLVENAIYHGFEATKRRGHIVIHGSSDGEAGVITVSDDGSGLPVEVGRALNGQRGDRDADRLGHGLKSVCERLRMYYGPGYGLFVCVGNETGTQLRLRFPKEVDRADAVALG
jgi:two-component system sensor histidine kinase YesM